MRKPIPLLIIAAYLIAVLGIPSVTNAADSDLRVLVDQLAVGSFKDRAKAVDALLGTGDPAVAPALEALGEGDLFARKVDSRVYIARKKGGNYELVDPLTGETVGEATSKEIKKIKVNNRLRRAIRTALGMLTLLNPDPDVRRAAAEAIYKSQDLDAIEPLEAAILKEQDSDVRRVMEEARAAAIVGSDAPQAKRLAAIEILRERGDRDALSVLSAVEASAEGELKDAADSAIRAIEESLSFWAAGQNIWYGLSLGSVLFLAAIGLAITFGVMGVINMAHGEMVMLGAYTTFVVQEVIRSHAPELFDASLLFALPLAFLISGAVGILIERSVIQWLYGRPLETLLATWGLSLILQQAVRSTFGPTNQQVGIPSWMSGAFELGKLTITYNRLWIIVFAMIVFVLLLVVLRRTSYGLQVRAVTQNRRMADALGIRTPLIDALTFGLGSGIAGIAGVALSQIDNVSPNLGQGYIVDSFMVVVFGGVGNFWGTLVGALSLGVVNKFVEPYAGAVLGKILVLVFIILFIQKRPRGLFALKGRAVEA